MAGRERVVDDRSPAEIRVDIERTRSHLDDTVDAIGDKLSPGRFVDELWTRVQSEGASAVAHTLREHPIPFSLVGAGLGWLVYERASGRSEPMRRPRRRARAIDGGYYEDGYDAEYESRYDAEYDDEGDGLGERMRHAKDSLHDTTSRMRRSASEAGHEVREKASSAAETVSEKLTDARESVSEKISDARDSMSETRESAARGVRRGAERAREGFWSMLERNPVAVGAIALGAGLAVGLSAPRTRWEDERMGRVARSFKRETKQVMEETAGKVMGVAQEAYDTAREEVREKGPEVLEDVKESAREVTQATMDAARERGRDEGLTTEGMQQAAARPAEAARRAAERK